jgi:hypothetical protein
MTIRRFERSKKKFYSNRDDDGHGIYQFYLHYDILFKFMSEWDEKERFNGFFLFLKINTLK